ncbi:ribosomal protein L25, Ctc-form [Bacteroidetes oral taxon 274 str. F0058]|jgi:ribosomal protein L25, ctc-form|nr:ribosomal protein L25, Ctc-form [Bacteroidetes oral taxon 274 str. F0058]
MKTFQLEGKPRKEIGKKAVKALRGEGLIPAVLYGHRSVELPYSGKLEDGQVLVENQGKGVVVTNFTVTTDAVRKLIYSPEVFIVELNIGGHKQTAMLKDLQLHPVTDEILHIDFLAVFPDIPMTIEVPVVLDGFAAGVRAGGKLNLISKKLKVKGLSKDIPEKLHINVENLELGKAIQIKHLNFDNLTLLNAPDNVVCVVAVTRGAMTQSTATTSEEEEKK